MKALSISKNKEVSFKEKSLTEIRAVRPRVYHLLKTYPDLRESDRKLIWEYWRVYELKVGNNGDYYNEPFITLSNFMEATNPETIRRSAQKIRELFPELRGSKYIQRGRKEKQESYSKKI